MNGAGWLIAAQQIGLSGFDSGFERSAHCQLQFLNWLRAVQSSRGQFIGQLISATDK
jgi:hypothetical protein